MTKEQIKAMLPDVTDDVVVTKILDALHGEIQPHKDAAKKAQDDLAARWRNWPKLAKRPLRRTKRLRHTTRFRRNMTQI